MKITILDGYALNPGDISNAPLEKIGHIVFFPDTSDDEQLIIDRIADSEIILINKVPITKHIMQKCPNLKYIGVCATGYNVVDIVAAKELGIAVTNVPSYSTNAVSQSVFAFILEFANKVNIHNQSVMAGDWVKASAFSYTKAPLFELAGKTLGIFGFGSIGRKVTEIANAFNMKVICYTGHPEKYSEYEKNGSVEFVSFEQLLNLSDIITLHAPLTEKTRGIINTSTLLKMKSNAILINTARGPLVNEQNLCDALNESVIAGYAADVISVEPMEKANPLLNAKNVLITPHIAWAAFETRVRLMGVVISNIQDFLNGKIVNRVES